MRRIFPLSICAAALALASEGDAYACGACFVQQSSPTVVSGHRMVVSISPKQTVLWDQIQYAGDPAEFAWVLPVKPGAVIQPATNAFFEVLEAATERQILSPRENCTQGRNGAITGCFGVATSASGDFGPQSNPVTVVHEGTVGPYETVTLQTSTAGALNGWLGMHGYNVDASSQPIIDAYVAEGFDFIAIRLQPGKGVRQMTPVRVVMPGATTTIPLRMVAIGTGDTVPIVLYVISEGRYRVADAPPALIETGLLSYDFATKSSNYATLRQAALAANGGLGWLTSYAQKGALFDYNGVAGPNGYAVPLLQGYAATAMKNGEASGRCDLQNVSNAYDYRGEVVNPCPPGAPFDSPQCGNVTPSTDIRSFVCGKADDIGVALLGLVPADTWITRLEATLPHSALGKDLTLAAADPQAPVARDLTAPIAEHPEKACPTTVLFPRLAPRATKGGPPGWALAAAFFASVVTAFGARRRRPVAARQDA